MRPILLILVTLLLLPWAPFSAEAGQTREEWFYGTEIVSQDAFVDEETPGTNFGTSNTLILGEDSSASFYHRNVFFQFNLSVIPADIDLQEFVIFMWKRDTLAGSGASNFIISRVTASWDEATITWNTQPARTTISNFWGLDAADEFEWVELPLTELARGWLDNSFANHGVKLERADQNVAHQHQFMSKEGDQDLRFRVKVIYTTLDSAVHVSYFNAFSGEGIPFEQFKLFLDTVNPPTTRRYSPTLSLVDGTTYEWAVEDFFDNTIANGTFTPDTDPDFLDISLDVTQFDLQFSDGRRHHARFEVGTTSIHTNLTPIPLYSGSTYNLEIYEDSYVFPKAEFALPDIDGFQQTYNVAVAPKSLSELYGNQTVEMHTLRLSNPSAGTQYVQLADDDVFDRTNASVSLSIWLIFHETGRTQRIGGKGFSFAYAYGLQLGPTDIVSAVWRQAFGGNPTDSLTGFTMEPDVLYHIGAEWTPTPTGVDVRFILNGTEVASKSSTVFLGDGTGGGCNADYCIGRTGDPNNFGNLTAADWQQYNRILTNGEWAELYSRGPQAVPLTNRDLTLHWTMADTWSGLVHDYSSGDFHGTLVGDPASVKLPSMRRSTIHFTIFDALGQPHARQDWVLYWGTQRVADRVATGVVGTSLNWSVRDLWGNLVASGTHDVDDWPDDFADVVLTGVHNLKIGNEEQELFILTELRHASSSTERAEFLFPLEVTSLWVVAGDYVLNVTPYTTDCKDATASGCTTGTLQSYSFTLSSAEAFLVSGEATARRLIDDLTVQGDRQEFVWDNSNRTWRRVRDLATPAGVALVFDSYFIPDWTRFPQTAKDLAPGSVIDPFRTLIYDVRNSTEAAASDMWRPWDLAWSDDDVDVLQDNLFLAVASGTVSRLWINDTIDTDATGDDTILLNMSFVPSYVDLLPFGNGLNLSIEAAGGGTVNASRVSTVKFVSTFLWSQDSVTERWTMTTTLDNDLSRLWTNIMVFVAFPESVTVDVSTVVVTDVTANVELDSGVHYTLNSGGISLGLVSMVSGDSTTWRVEFFEMVSGSAITEPQCTLGQPTTAKRGLVDYQRVSVTCSNINNFDYTGRIVIVFNLPRPVDHASVIIEDTSGNRLPGSPYWNDARTLIIPGVSVSALSSLNLVAWFQYESDILTPAQILPYLPMATLLLAAAAGISFWSWGRQPRGSDKQERARVATVLFGILGVIAFILWTWLEISLGV